MHVECVKPNEFPEEEVITIAPQIFQIIREIAKFVINPKLQKIQ
jgi:hypothetical protein